MKAIICLLMAIAFVSCSGSGHRSTTKYKVTVVAVKTRTILLNHMRVSVVTESGDTVCSMIEDSVLFRNRIPFAAEMTIGDGMTMGRIYR